jgi:hypothetical protein
MTAIQASDLVSAMWTGIHRKFSRTADHHGR